RPRLSEVESSSWRPFGSRSSSPASATFARCRWRQSTDSFFPGSTARPTCARSRRLRASPRTSSTVRSPSSDRSASSSSRGRRRRGRPPPPRPPPKAARLPPDAPMQIPPAYDVRELDEDCDLEMSQRHRVLDLFHRLDGLDFYALLGVARDADKKAIK